MANVIMSRTDFNKLTEEEKNDPRTRFTVLEDGARETETNSEFKILYEGVDYFKYKGGEL
jgi:RecA/RadA recombinase